MVLYICFLDNRSIISNYRALVGRLRILKKRDTFRPLGSLPLDYLSTVNNLAAIYYQQVIYANSSTEDFCSEPKYIIFVVLSLIRVTFVAQGKFDEAKAKYLQALKGRERLLPATHPDIVSTIYNLALVLKKQGSSSEAGVYFEKAYNLYESILGPTHHLTRMCRDAMTS